MKQTKRYLLALLLVAIPLYCSAAEAATADPEPEPGLVTSVATAPLKAVGAFRGYSGGMMLHIGYQYGTAPGFCNDAGQNVTLRSMTYGLGGALRVHLLNHLRVGAEGYVSTMPLKSQGEGSNVRTGWGGALIDCYATLGKIQPFVGGTIGGGAQRSTHVFTGESVSGGTLTWKEQWELIKGYQNLEETYPAEYTKHGFFALDPFIGFEYAATQKLHMIVRVDWLLAIHNNHLMTPTGPRLFIGLMFTH